MPLTFEDTRFNGGISTEMALPTANKLLLKMGEESTVCFNEAKAEFMSLG